MGIVLHAFRSSEPWFLSTKDAYIIPSTVTISPCNSYSCIPQRDYKLPKDKTHALSLFLYLAHTYLTVPARTGFAGLDIHGMTMKSLNPTVYLNQT